MKNYPVTNPETGKQDWVSRSVAVAVTLFSEVNGEFCVLANKRGKGVPGQNFSNPGKWNVISGYIDYDETLKEACVREVKEETGVDIETSYIDLFDIEDDPKRENQVILFRYAGIHPNGDMYELTNKYSEQNEVEEVKWIPIDEVDNYTWTSKKHKEKIKEYAELFLVPEDLVN